MSSMIGKVIAITGGAGGIGEATARMAHAQGASVVITDREADRSRRLLNRWAIVQYDWRWM